MTNELMIKRLRKGVATLPPCWFCTGEGKVCEDCTSDEQELLRHDAIIQLEAILDRIRQEDENDGRTVENQTEAAKGSKGSH